VLCESIIFLKTEFGTTNLMSATVAGLIALIVAAVFHRASRNNWDYSFMGRSYFTFELLNWNKYGFYSVIFIALLILLAFFIMFFPPILRACTN
jgi:hypothetical protein